MLDLLLESVSDFICYRRSDSLENTYREVRESVDHANRRDHKLVERPDDVHNLHIWRSMRDSEQGDSADNQSNSTASMMGWLCTKTAKAHLGSPVANVMDTAVVLQDGDKHGDGIKMDSKKLRTAWIMSYEVSQLRWIDQLKEGMNNPTKWYFRALTAALNQPRAEIMCMNKCICTDESQPTDFNYKRNDEVPLSKKPLDCWWEPISVMQTETGVLHKFDATHEYSERSGCV